MAFQQAIDEAIQRGFHNLAEDLQREYYTTLDALERMFHAGGFFVEFTRLNKFVWLMEAVKQ
jgi:putative AdoMet-dependent methyltransferase